MLVIAIYYHNIYKTIIDKILVCNYLFWEINYVYWLLQYRAIINMNLFLCFKFLYLFITAATFLPFWLLHIVANIKRKYIPKISKICNSIWKFSSFWILWPFTWQTNILSKGIFAEKGGILKCISSYRGCRRNMKR